MKLLVSLVGLTLLGFNACSQQMSDAFFAETVADSRQAHQVSRDLVTAHDENITEQHKAMSPETAEAIDALRAEFAVRAGELQKQADSIHSSVGENAKELAFVGARMIERFAGLPPGTVQSYVDEADDILNGNAIRAMAAIEIATREKLDALDDVQLKALTELRFDNESFRAQLQSSADLTDMQIEALKGIDPTTLLSILGMAVAAAGGGGLMARTGKSRGTDDIEKLKDAINAITTEAAKKT